MVTAAMKAVEPSATPPNKTAVRRLRVAPVSCIDTSLVAIKPPNGCLVELQSTHPE